MDIMPSYVGRQDKDDWNIVTPDYFIKDFVITDDKNEAIATTCHTCLLPGKSTRGHIDENNEVYFFMSGEGVMVIEHEVQHIDATYDLTKSMLAGKKDEDSTPSVFVKKGQFHKVLNISAVRNLNFLSVVPGKVKRMPYPQTESHLSEPHAL